MDAEKPPRIVPVQDLTEMAARPLRDVYSYWDGLRAGRAMPSRQDMKPMTLGPLLPCLALIEVLDQGRDYRFRLVGTQLDSILRLPLTNSLLSDYPQADGRDSVKESYDLCVQTRQPHLSSGQLGHLDQHFILYDNLILPLSNDDTAVNMLVTYTHMQRVARADKPSP